MNLSFSIDDHKWIPINHFQQQLESEQVTNAIKGQATMTQKEENFWQIRELVEIYCLGKRILISLKTGYDCVFFEGVLTSLFKWILKAFRL